jgi:hypothetical protein
VKLVWRRSEAVPAVKKILTEPSRRREKLRECAPLRSAPPLATVELGHTAAVGSKTRGVGLQRSQTESSAPENLISNYPTARRQEGAGTRPFDEFGLCTPNVDRRNEKTASKVHFLIQPRRSPKGRFGPAGWEAVRLLATAFQQIASRGLFVHGSSIFRSHSVQNNAWHVCCALFVSSDGTAAGGRNSMAAGSRAAEWRRLIAAGTARIASGKLIPTARMQKRRRKEGELAYC